MKIIFLNKELKTLSSIAMVSGDVNEMYCVVIVALNVLAFHV